MGFETFERGSSVALAKASVWLGVLAVVALASGPASADTGASDPAAAVDEEIRPYVLAPEVGMIFKLRPNRWEKLAPFFDRFTGSSDGAGSESENRDAAAAGSNLQRLRRMVRKLGPGEILEEVDSARSIYVVVRTRPAVPEQACQEAGLPASVVSGTKSLRVRVLVPAENPAALQSELSRWLRIPAMAAVPMEGWLRIEYGTSLREAASEGERAVEKALASMPVASGTPRISAARGAVMLHDGAGAFWVSSRGLIDLYADERGDVSPGSGPEEGDNWFDRLGREAIEAASVYGHDVPRAAEIEGYSVLVQGDGSGGAAVDFVISPTRQGRRVAHAYAVDAEFPNPTVLTPDVDLRIVGSIGRALAAARRPAWMDADRPRPPTVDGTLREFASLRMLRAPFALTWRTDEAAPQKPGLGFDGRFQSYLTGRAKGDGARVDRLDVSVTGRHSRVAAAGLRRELGSRYDRTKIEERKGTGLVVVGQTGRFPDGEGRGTETVRPGVHLEVDSEFTARLDSVSPVLEGAGLKPETIEPLAEAIDPLFAGDEGFEIGLRTIIRRKYVRLRAHVAAEDVGPPEIPTAAPLRQPTPRCTSGARRVLYPLLREAVDVGVEEMPWAKRLAEVQPEFLEALEACDGREGPRSRYAKWASGGFLAWRAMAELRARDVETGRRLAKEACERGVSWGCEVSMDTRESGR